MNTNYTGIVLVSHSPKIAEGLKEFIRQVIQEVPIEPAAGTKEGDIGTNAEKIMQAIKHADHDKGVLVFYDIGSARMNAEMALEMLGSDNFRIIDAPLLEGSYVAAVESGMGKDMGEIADAVAKEFR